MDRVIAWDKTKIEGVAVLPASKSISNRALVLCALAGCPVPENLSDSDDTRVLREALSTSDRLVNVGHAGTAMRFLTAYFALKGGVRFGTYETASRAGIGGCFAGIRCEYRLHGR